MEKRKHSPVFFFAASPAGAQTCWRPSADVYRIPRGWLLKFDLAGVRMEDVTVEVHGFRISVSGVFRGRSGPAMLQLDADAKTISREKVDAMIESIK